MEGTARQMEAGDRRPGRRDGNPRSPPHPPPAQLPGSLRDGPLLGPPPLRFLEPRAPGSPRTRAGRGENKAKRAPKEMTLGDLR